jgi:hypothetical protein
VFITYSRRQDKQRKFEKNLGGTNELLFPFYNTVGERQASMSGPVLLGQPTVLREYSIKGPRFRDKPCQLM